MASITQKYLENEEINGITSNFFSQFQIGALLKKCNGCKEKGISAAKLRNSKFSNVFMDWSKYMLKMKARSFSMILKKS